MGDMFFQDQKQREQAQLKLQMDSQQFIQNAPISMDAEMLSGQYTYFEKTESVLTSSIPKDAKIEQAAVMSPQERSKKSKDEKELDKRALVVREKERDFKRSLTIGQLPEADKSKEQEKRPKKTWVLCKGHRKSCFVLC